MNDILETSEAKNIVMIHDGRFRGKLGTLIPQQVIQLSQTNNYGCDFQKVLKLLADRDYLKGIERDDIEFMEFSTQFKRFKVSGRNLDSLFNSASKVAIHYIYKLKNLNPKSFANELYQTNSHTVKMMERLTDVMFIYLMTNVMIEGQKVKTETEVRDSVTIALSTILNLFEAVIYDSNGDVNKDEFRRYPETISKSMYAQILADKFVDVRIIDELASADSRFNDGYDVIQKIIVDKHNHSHGFNAQKQLGEIKLETTNLASIQENRQTIYNNKLSNILKVKQVILELQNIEKIRNNLDEIEDIIVNEYKNELLQLTNGM